MKKAIYSLLIAALASSNAVNAESGPPGRYGAGGRGSPFEQFRNPNSADEDTGSDAGPIEVESLPEEEKFEFEKVMTPVEEACYLARYTDVTDMTANEHYARIGEKGGRNIRCQNFMTSISGQRYARRYADLGNLFGRTKGGQALKLQREHWYNNGSKQAPPLSVRVSYPQEEPYKCSDYGGECSCPGHIHFGHKFRQDNGEQITTLPVFLDFNKKTKFEEGFELHMTCDRSMFKKGKVWEKFTDDELQCFCEPFLTQEPYHCADDGDDCQCKNGNVFYGEKFKHHGQKQVATFQEMLDDGEYLVGEIKKNIQCEPESFVGHELFEDFGNNGCYCDDIGAVDITYIRSEIEWWTSRIEEMRIQEYNSRIEAEAEAARMAAAHDNSLLQQEMAEMEARMKQAESDYAHAQEEAHAKAAARAAQDKADAAADAKAEAALEKQLASDKAAREKEHEAALAAAEAAATAAAKEHAADARRKLMAEAEKAKQAAIKSQVAATIAAQQEHAAILLAEQKAKHEADKRAQQATQDEARRLQEAEEKRRIAIDEAKKQEMIAAMQQAHSDELAAQAEQAKAAAQKKLAQALERQQSAYEAKMAAEAAERARLEKIKQEEEAKKLAAKLAAEKAAEEAQKKAEEEERIRKANELAAHRQLMADEKAAAEEEALLTLQAQEQEAARVAAQQAATKAAADLALAKSEGDKQRAMEAQRVAEEAQKVALVAERASKLKKMHLEEEIKKKRLVAELASKAAKEAEQKKLAAQAAAADWKVQAEEAAAESLRLQAAATADLEAKKAELEAERARQVAKHNAALKVQAETYRLASLAADAAHAAAERARRAKEEEQIAAHKRQMSARRDAFEKAFRNVWATGDTGVSLIHLTVPGHSDDLIARLFKQTMVADVADVKQEVKKSWNNHGNYKYDVLRHKLVMISSDDRIAEVIEETALFMAKFGEPIPFDLVVTPLATGSKEYIQWVKLQTLKKDDDTAFFNVQAESEMQALTSRVE